MDLDSASDALSLPGDTLDLDTVELPSPPSPPQQDDCISLPSEGGTTDDEVELPAQHCSKNCFQHFESDDGKAALQEVLERLQAKDRSAQNVMLYHLLLSLRREGTKLKYTLCGFPVCRDCWRKLLHIGQSRLGRLLKGVKEGLPAPPADLREGVHPKLSAKSLQVEQFMYWLYHYVAEPLAEGLSVAAVATLIPSNVDEWAKKSTSFIKSELGTRYLHHTTVERLYDWLQEWLQDCTPCKSWLKKSCV
eukprot:6492697-Amphidinium_carterae.2